MTISSPFVPSATSNNGGAHDHLMFYRNVWYHEDSTPTSTMLLIAFNMASAGLLMAMVFFDAWKASKRNGTSSSEKRLSFLQFIGSGDVFTLSFTASVLIQGTVLTIIQSWRMSPSIFKNCGTIGQIVFPALWIVGLVILVFGVEMLYRGFQRERFAPRKKEALYVCWAVIILLTGLSWIPTHVRRSKLAKCPFGLLSIVKPWSDVALGITIAFIVFYTLIALILAMQLLRSKDVDPMERIATSQMVYYLAIGTAIFTFFLPFWARITVGIPQGITPMMAIVSINVIGIIASFFQLLFRSYTESMTIRYSESSRNRRWGKGLKRQISSPIAIPSQEESLLFDDSFNSMERSINSRAGSVKVDTDKSLPPTPPSIIQPPKDEANKKTSYSIFPTKASARMPKHPVSSIYDDDDDIFLIPPRPAFAAHHHRNSSDVSHATVQIGFRLSNLDPPPRVSKMGGNREPSSAATASRTFSRFLAPPLPPPFSTSTRPNANNHISTTSIDVPVTLRSPATEQPPHLPFPPVTITPAAPTSPSTPSIPPMPSLPSSPSPAASRLRSSTIPAPAQPITSGGARSPAVYKKLDDLQKLLETDLQAAQQAAADSGAWPLRDSLPDLLPKSTYRPE